MGVEEKVEKFLARNDRTWFQNFLLNTFDKGLPESLWLRQFTDLPPFYLYFAAGLFNLAFWTVFFFFVVRTYDSGVHDSYISLDPDSGDCKEVPRVFTGSYLGDTAGHWDTDDRFDVDQSLYKADFLGYQRTTSEFQADMATISADILQLGERGKYRDLAFNLLAQSTYEHTIRVGGTGQFTFSLRGDLTRALRRAYNYHFVSSPGGLFPSEECNDFTFNPDFSNGLFETTWSLGGDDAIEACDEIASFLAEPGRGTPDEFSLSLNLASLSMAAAVNYRVFPLTQLEKVAPAPVPHGGYYYGGDDLEADIADISGDFEVTVLQSKDDIRNAKQSVVSEGIQDMGSIRKKSKSRRSLSHDSEFADYFNPSKDSMDLISCVTIHDVTEGICFIRNGKGFGYPVLRHYVKTNCSDESVWKSQHEIFDVPGFDVHDGNWDYRPDHIVDIQVGILYFNEDDAYDLAREAADVIYGQEDGDLVMTELLFRGFDAEVPTDLAFTEGCGRHTVTGELRNCSLFFYNTWGTGNEINADQVALYAGACRNSVFSPAALAKSHGLAAAPPEKLVYIFYTCVLHPFDAVFEAIGLSLGNADFYVKYCFFFFMFSLVLYLHFTRSFDPKLGEFESVVQARMKEEEEERKAKRDDAEGNDATDGRSAVGTNEVNEPGIGLTVTKERRQSPQQVGVSI